MPALPDIYLCLTVSLLPFLLILVMTKTNLLKPCYLEQQHGKNLGVKDTRPVCKDATRRNAVSDRREGDEQSSLEDEKTSPSSTNRAERVASSMPISTWLSPTPFSGLYCRALVILFGFAFWRTLSYSVSISIASSSNQLNNVNSVPHSGSRCNSSFCYSISLNFRKPEGLLPTFSPQTTGMISSVLKSCKKDNTKSHWDEMPNGRRYEMMCSDTFIQNSAEVNVDGGRATGSCLAECISDNSVCEGVLFLIDRPFERRCFFQHNNQRPAFEASERVLGARLIKD